MRRISRLGAFLFISGLVVGALVILGIRFFSYKPDSVHYHANFAVYINGQREKFQGPRYYEETGEASCSTDKAANPTERAHMHDKVNDVVHVEDHLVTWGNFFQNIGWTINPGLIQSPSQTLLADQAHRVSFLLNGKLVPDVTGLIIQDKDKLLVDYGDSSDALLQTEYKSVPVTAQQYDVSKDPASCGSNAPITARQRLSHLF